MSHRSWLVLAALVATSTSCRTSDSDNTASKTIEAAGSGGTTVYFAQGGSAYRYLCQDGFRDKAKTFDDLKATCAARGEMPLAELDQKLTKLYLAKTESDASGNLDEKLNTFERTLKQRMLTCLATFEACDALSGIGKRQRVAAGHLHAHMLGLMEEVFGGPINGANLAIPSPPEESASFALAGESLELARGEFRIPLIRQETTVALPVERSEAYTQLGFELTGAACTARIAGLVSVQTADGQLLTGPAALVPAGPSSFAISSAGTAGVRITQIQVLVRKSQPGAPRCTVVATGVTGDDDGGGGSGGGSGGGTGDGGGGSDGGSTDPTCSNGQQRDDIMRAWAAEPRHRLWHHLWHGVRAGWDALGPLERQQIVNRLGPSWSRQPADENIGEEFLQMHHLMYRKVKTLLESKGCKMYDAWTQPPAPNDASYVTFSQNIPQGGYDQLMTWHEQASQNAKSPQLTLGRYGEWLERGLHDSFHQRHADQSKVSLALNTLPRFFNIPSDPKHPLNQPDMDYLAHPYASHVNPYFYRLHGYFEARLSDWLKSHGYEGLFGEDGCNSAPSCYRWRRPWAGDVPVEANGLALVSTDEHAGHDVSLEAVKQLPDSVKRAINMHANMFPVEELDPL